MKKKILILLIGNIRYDGRVKKEIGSLLKFGYDVTLICTKFDREDSLSNYQYKIHVVNHPSGSSPLKKIWNKLIYRKSLNKIISDERPDFIHCNDNTLFYVGKWIKKVKVIYDAHELLPQMAHGFRRKLTLFHERKYLKYVYKIILPQIDRLNYFYFEYKHIIQRPQ